MRTPFVRVCLLAAALLPSAPLAAQSAAPPSRLVIGGRGAALVADAVYAFPGLRGKVAAAVRPDQGLGVFLSAVDPAFAAKAVLERTAGAESYAALRPDLVLLKSYVRASLGAGLEGLGLSVLYLDLEAPADFYRDLARLGDAFGEAARAAELSAFYRRLQDDTAARVGALAPPRTLLVQGSPGSGLWEAAPADWMQTHLVRLAGGDPVWTGAVPGSGWTRIGAEQIAAWNPEAVIIVDYAGDPAVLAAEFRADPRFARLAAVTSGRVRAMPQDFYSWDQADTRWILGLRRIAAFLHPEAFAGVDAEAETRDFFALLYGFDRGRFDAVILPKLRGDHGGR
jgi:iron complex transport system substrate-binding protein